MGVDFFSSPSTSDIYTATDVVLSAAPTCGSGQQSLNSPAGTNCTIMDNTNMTSEAWYAGNWTNPAAWLIIVYCVASACTLLLMMFNGYLDGHLNLNLSPASSAQRELRRRRRHSQRMEDWMEVERRQAEEAEMAMDEEEERVARSNWLRMTPQEIYDQHEQLPTLYAGMDVLQREAMYERHARDAVVLVRLERAGLV